MNNRISGTSVTYGQLAGILMLDTRTPRIAGDPGHAETFSFPVRYGVVPDFPFDDLVGVRRDRLQNVIDTAIHLQNEGVKFIAADCGLFSCFQQEIASALDIPFVGSALNFVPFLVPLLQTRQKIAIITGHTDLLTAEHLQAAGISTEKVFIIGMENCDEFRRVVIDRDPHLDPEAMREGVVEVARQLSSGSLDIGAVIIECTNLITFRKDIQTIVKRPVFDITTLMNFMAEGYRLHTFESKYF